MKSLAHRTRIVALGGTVKPDSSTERALQLAVTTARELGADVTVFDGAYLTALPHYGAPNSGNAQGRELVEAVRGADGLIVAAPGYHGSLSGVVKNALDFFEDLAADERPYLDGRAVGLIATAYGDQAATSTLAALRTITHALRGWPTPMGAAVRSHSALFSPDGQCVDDRVRQQIECVAQQCVLGARSLVAGGLAERIAS